MTFILFMEKLLEEVEIPFCGGGGKISSSDTAAWLRNEDKVPLLLAISLYTQPYPEMEGYQLVPGSYRIRVAAWFNTQTGSCVIGCRGTSIGKAGGESDLKDDKVSLLVY